MRETLLAGPDAPNAITAVEAFYYAAKMLSLAAGAYTQSF
jgi:hypothetical protein